LEIIYEMVCESKIKYGIEVSVLNKAWKVIEKVHDKFYKKLMWSLSCAENGFAEMELAGESRKIVSSRAKELKEEFYSVRTVFVWLNLQERSLINISRLVKGRCNVVERQNLFVKLSVSVQ
jgi:hypothetical protein